MSKLFPNVIRIKNILNSQQVRWLPRWSHRQPVRVIPAEEYDKNEDKHINAAKEEFREHAQMLTKIKWRQSVPNLLRDNEKNIDKPQEYKFKRQKTAKPLTISKNKKNSEAIDMLEAVIDKEGNFIYTKMKNNDSRISSILVEVKSKKEKKKKDLILLEGKRLIKDALCTGCKLEYILFSRMKELDYLRPFLPKLGAKLYKMPYREMQMWSDLTTNPGIMGIFKIPDKKSVINSINNLPLTVICDNVREPNNLGAILRTCSGVGCDEVMLTKGCVNVWDTKVLRSAMGAHFKLRIRKELNWNDIRQEIESRSKVYIADNHVVSSDESNFENHNLVELLQAVPVLPYYGVDFLSDRHIVLIIGGETEGISEESYKLASDLKGVRLNVPLSNNVDSLNTGTALGIIVFEMKRQLSILQKKEEEIAL